MEGRERGWGAEEGEVLGGECRGGEERAYEVAMICLCFFCCLRSLGRGCCFRCITKNWSSSHRTRKLEGRHSTRRDRSSSALISQGLLASSSRPKRRRPTLRPSPTSRPSATHPVPFNLLPPLIHSCPRAWNDAWERYLASVWGPVSPIIGNVAQSAQYPTCLTERLLAQRIQTKSHILDQVSSLPPLDRVVR